MSKVIFVRCSNKDCKNKAYPVDIENKDRLKLCPECDPKNHHAVKMAKQQATMLSNAPKRQGGLDAGRVSSLEAGGVILEDKPGVEVEVTHATPDASDAGLDIPVITATEAKAQAQKGRKGKGKK